MAKMLAFDEDARRGLETDDVAGDGTTTATVLAQALVREGLRNVAAGADPLSLKRGIEQAVEAVTEQLHKNAVDVQTRQRIAATAAISAGDQGIGDMIAEAMDKVGRDGVITVEESNALGMELELTEGMRFDKGFLSAYFVTDAERQEAVLTGDEATGANIVKVAVDAPLKQIAVNAGLEGGVVADKVRGLPQGRGVNALTGDYEDLVSAGVIDPAKVTRSALQNAASIAALFLTTEAVVAEKPEKEEKSPAPAGMDF